MTSIVYHAVVSVCEHTVVLITVCLAIKNTTSAAVCWYYTTTATTSASFTCTVTTAIFTQI